MTIAIHIKKTKPLSNLITVAQEAVWETSFDDIFNILVAKIWKSEEIYTMYKSMSYYKFADKNIEK